MFLGDSEEAEGPGSSGPGGQTREAGSSGEAKEETRSPSRAWTLTFSKEELKREGSSLANLKAMPQDELEYALTGISVIQGCDCGLHPRGVAAARP